MRIWRLEDLDKEAEILDCQRFLKVASLHLGDRCFIDFLQLMRWHEGLSYDIGKNLANE